MVTDAQVRRLMKFIQTEDTLSLAAAKAGMDEKTARRYRRRAQVPSQLKTDHTWRTRADPFAEVWDDLKELLVLNPGLEAKTLFDHLQREYPGRFQDGQLRTLQRRVKRWRALHGPAKGLCRNNRSIFSIPGWMDGVVPVSVKGVTFQVDLGHLFIAEGDALGIRPLVDFGSDTQSGFRGR